MNIEDTTGENNLRREIVSCPLANTKCEHKFEEYCIHNINFEKCEWYEANEYKGEKKPLLNGLGVI